MGVGIEGPDPLENHKTLGFLGNKSGPPACTDSESSVRGVQTMTKIFLLFFVCLLLFFFFLVYEDREKTNANIRGLSSVRQRNALNDVSLACQ